MKTTHDHWLLSHIGKSGETNPALGLLAQKGYLSKESSAGNRRENRIQLTKSDYEKK